MQELDYAKVGARIRQIRKAKGWSQDELARKCRISMNFIFVFCKITIHNILQRIVMFFICSYVA